MDYICAHVKKTCLETLKRTCRHSELMMITANLGFIHFYLPHNHKYKHTTEIDNQKWSIREIVCCMYNKIETLWVGILMQVLGVPVSTRRRLMVFILATVTPGPLILCDCELALITSLGKHTL